MTSGGVRRRWVAGLTVLVAMGLTGPVASAQAAPVNPTPLTDLAASLFPLGTGGTQRICATSNRGIPVHCVERVRTMPSASPGADGVTFGHWIFCKNACTGSLLVHEMVHVAQFEYGGDVFGPQYLAEAALHGTGCENQYERPAYQTSGRCL